ncbi:hypothetical protein H109_06528 [Trichophyton interdigitale MR816]|uniref:Uncharacterized protein n=1 Tax=Trichophyton interdigitale (strain MR816) TaxID=1215338 RepID=A0A059J1H3_TRIIM|nr:hypothetical protein H109_06528 [Trichophyton interdigitale MR816]
MPDQKPGKLGRVLSFASNKSRKSASNQQPLSPQKTSSSSQQQQQQQQQQARSPSQRPYGHARNNTDLSDKSADRPGSNKMRTHADPTLAMSEAQPAAIALQESSLGQLRGIQHKDRFGNPITEPDLSNPTRYRFERPLDTIRSFEAAIDGTYGSRRMSYARPDESTNGHSRPTSFFGGDRSNGQYYQRGGYDSYSVSRGYQSRPESYVDAYGNGYGSAADMNQYNYSNQRPARAGPPRQAPPPRTNSDPNYAYSSYPTHNPSTVNSYYTQPQYQGQQDNPNSNSPSGSGGRSVDHWVNSTDPSSVNSSMDRLAQQQQHHPQGQKYDDQPTESYGFTGFGADPQLEQSQQLMNPGQENIYSLPPRLQQQKQQYQAPPTVPRKEVPVSVPPPAVTGATLQEGKRKSWFKRRISRT